MQNHELNQSKERGNPMIEVSNIQKSFGSVKALKGVSFTASDGQITGLLGPNGAGKTTALRLLYTLMKPDAGTAWVDGHEITRDSMQVRQRIGALPDSYGLYPRLTGRENVRYYGRLQGVNKQDLENRIVRLAKLLDMQDFFDRRTEGFSTGQRLKVAIARALVHEPQNVLLDEPTNGLDVMSTRAMRLLIQRLSEEGKCVLFSSHIMQEVSALCDRIVIIANGEVAATGTPDDLKAQTGQTDLEEAFISLIGTEEGITR
jgi:sodium transport system ATP-binding protein